MMDVARLAGVSHQTVSRVVNESERVAADTRARVLAAMRELDFQPSSVARALKTGRSRTIGVVSFDTTLYGPASTLFGIERAAHHADYFTSVVSLPGPERESLLMAVERLRRQGVEGVLAVAPQIATIQELPHISRGVPLVAVEGGPDEGVPMVVIDQFAGAAAATQHLLELGHATVFHIAGPRDWQEAELRLAGWRETLRRADAPIPVPLFGDWTPQSGYARGRELARAGQVTAVFVGNDQMALGLLRALHEAGRRVPEDVSVVGFDAIPEAPFFTPPLTTIRQDFIEMGRRSFELLLGQIEAGERRDVRVMIEPELILGASTASPAVISSARTR